MYHITLATRLANVLAIIPVEDKILKQLDNIQQDFRKHPKMTKNTEAMIDKAVASKNITLLQTIIKNRGWNLHLWGQMLQAYQAYLMRLIALCIRKMEKVFSMIPLVADLETKYAESLAREEDLKLQLQESKNQTQKLSKYAMNLATDFEAVSKSYSKSIQSSQTYLMNLSSQEANLKKAIMTARQLKSPQSEIYELSSKLSAVQASIESATRMLAFFE